MTATPIVAGFHGTCACCPHGIRPGDVICNINLTWRHVACTNREVGE